MTSSCKDLERYKTFSIRMPKWTLLPIIKISFLQTNIKYFTSFKNKSLIISLVTILLFTIIITNLTYSVGSIDLWISQGVLWL